MFEESMKKHLRKKGYIVRRRRHPGHPVQRTLAGTILGGVAGYYLDKKNLDALSRVMPELQQYLAGMYSAVEDVGTKLGSTYSDPEMEPKMEPKRARRVVGNPRPAASSVSLQFKDIGGGIKAIRNENGVAVWSDQGNALLLRPEAILELAILWNGPPLMREDEEKEAKAKPGCGKCGDHASEKPNDARHETDAKDTDPPYAA